MKPNPELINDPRIAGTVTRWHVVPTLHGQLVAEHSWNVVRIVLAIWPDAPRELILEALFHDCGEVETGDPPSTLKNRDSRLAPIYKEIENEVRLGMSLPWGLPAPVKLLPSEAIILKLADLMEMLEFALYEHRLGNQFVGPVIPRLYDAISFTLVSMGIRDIRRVNAEAYLERRLSVWPMTIDEWRRAKDQGLKAK